MICCKIIADYKNSQGNFQLLLDTLANYGDFLWDNNTLFFSETDSNHFTEKKIQNILKKSGYTKYFIDVYDENNQPQETQNINIWLANKLIRINYNNYQKENQKVFSNISKGLDMLETEIDNMSQANQEKQNKTMEAELNG